MQTTHYARAVLAIACACAMAYAGASMLQSLRATQATQSARMLACDAPVQRADNRAEVIAMLRDCY